MPDVAVATPSVPVLTHLLREHFGADPSRFPVTERRFAEYERADLQAALEPILRHADASLYGVIDADYGRAPELARLCLPRTSRHYELGPVEYVEVPLGDGSNVACVADGLLLFRGPHGPIAMLLQGERRLGVAIEVMASTKEEALAFMRFLRRHVNEESVYRGKILSVEQPCGQVRIRFRELPKIERDGIILPADVVERIERQTIAFSRHAERLRASRRHIKRGVLLYGPPGTGKTLSAMYLASQMQGRTVFLVTASGLNAFGTVARLARALAPSTIVIEDVDLIGAERGEQEIGANALLFELLDAMDGLAEDADLLFLLTTNRPEHLEPALAARPGRIDQAIEVPLPDLNCRRRLFELYAKGLTVEATNVEALLSRCEGVSAAFLKELLRKAAVFAAIESEREDRAADVPEKGDERDTPLIVRDRHLDEAIGEMLHRGSALTRKLLGARTESGV
jgi:hypothetical protein